MVKRTMQSNASMHTDCLGKFLTRLGNPFLRLVKLSRSAKAPAHRTRQRSLNNRTCCAHGKAQNFEIGLQMMRSTSLPKVILGCNAEILLLRFTFWKRFNSRCLAFVGRRLNWMMWAMCSKTNCHGGASRHGTQLPLTFCSADSFRKLQRHASFSISFMIDLTTFKSPVF